MDITWEFISIFVVMAALTVVALYCMERVRSRYGYAVQRVAESTAPLDDDGLLRGPEKTWDERYLEVIPSVMLVVGLFGTFVGLANSIASAGQAIQSGGTHTTLELQRQFTALSHAVSGIGLKFDSSLTGIALHLLLRLAIGVRVQPVQEAWRRLAEHQSGQRRAAAESTRQRHDAEVVRCLRATAECLEALKHQVAIFTVLPDAVQLELQALARTGEAVRGTVEALRGAAHDARAAQQQTSEALSQTRAAVQEATAAQLALGTSARELNTTLESVDERWAGAVTEFAGTQRALSEAARELNSTIDAMDKRWAQTVNTAGAALAGRMATEGEALNTALKASSGEFAAQMARATSEFSESLREQLDVHAKSLASNMSDGAKAFSRDLSKQLTSSVRSAENGCTKAIERFAQKLEEGAGGIQSGVEACRAALFEEMKSHAALLPQTYERIHLLVDARVQRLDALSESIHTAVTTLEGSLREDRSAWAQAVGSSQASGWRDLVSAVREEHARTRAELALLRPEAHPGIQSHDTILMR